MNFFEQIIYLFILLFFTGLSVHAFYAFTGDTPTSYITADGEKITLDNNRSAIDPTYAQMLDFLKHDNTSEKNYSSHFVCADFAKAVHDNAERNGYRCAFVFVEFCNDSDCHACNAFNTTDRGLIFIDCISGDKIVTAAEDYQYTLSSAAFGDTVTEWQSLGIVRNVIPVW